MKKINMVVIESKHAGAIPAFPEPEKEKDFYQTLDMLLAKEIRSIHPEVWGSFQTTDNAIHTFLAPSLYLVHIATLNDPRVPKKCIDTTLLPEWIHSDDSRQLLLFEHWSDLIQQGSRRTDVLNYASNLFEEALLSNRPMVIIEKIFEEPFDFLASLHSEIEVKKFEVSL